MFTSRMLPYLQQVTLANTILMKFPITIRLYSTFLNFLTTSTVRKLCKNKALSVSDPHPNTHPTKKFRSKPNKIFIMNDYLLCIR